MKKSKSSHVSRKEEGLVVVSEDGCVTNQPVSSVSKMVETISDFIPGNMVAKQVSRAVGGLKDFLQAELRERRAHELKMHKMNLGYNSKNPRHPLKAAKQKRKFGLKFQKGDEGGVTFGIGFESDKGHDF